MPQTIYRIVSSDPPTDDDYLTYEQMGKASNLDSPLHLRMAQGYSCFVSLAKARSRAKGVPWRGNAYIATYELGDDDPFEMQQTGNRAAHYTVWCEAAVLMRALRAVVPVREYGDGS